MLDTIQHLKTQYYKIEKVDTNSTLSHSKAQQNIKHANLLKIRYPVRKKSRNIISENKKNILHDELKIVVSVHIFLENYYQMKKGKCQ